MTSLAIGEIERIVQTRMESLGITNSYGWLT